MVLDFYAFYYFIDTIDDPDAIVTIDGINTMVAIVLKFQV